MSGGFFRGTSAEQDTRFSNKQAKLMKSQKFPPELDHLVDVSKVKMDVIKPWIAKRATELLGFEDEVLINFIYELLGREEINGKEVQISLTGFMEKHTSKFMKELWNLLLSAQNNASGVPQQFLDAKEEETRKKKEELDRIGIEIQKRKEKGSRESDYGNLKMDDRAGEDSSENPNSRFTQSKGSRAHLDDDEAGGRNGFRGRSRERNKSRSISKSPRERRRFISPKRKYRSPRRSITPPRCRQTLKNSRSPRRRSPPERSISRSPKRRSPPGRSISRSPRRRSPPVSRSHYRSPSPSRHRLRSPRNRRSPLRLRSRSPLRRRSPSPRRRRSPSPWRRRSPAFRRQRSRSPWRRRSPSPRRRRSPSPLRRRRRRSTSSQSLVGGLPSPPVRRSVSSAQQSPSPVKRRSPAPTRGKQPTPHESSSPRSSPSPIGHRPPHSLNGRKSPALSRSPSRSTRNHERSSSPVRSRKKRPETPSEGGRRELHSRGNGGSSISPSTRREVKKGSSVSPSHLKSRGYSGSPQPLDKRSPSKDGRGSSGHHRRSPQSSEDNGRKTVRGHEKDELKASQRSVILSKQMDSPKRSAVHTNDDSALRRRDEELNRKEALRREVATPIKLKEDVPPRSNAPELSPRRDSRVTLRKRVSRLEGEEGMKSGTLLEPVKKARRDLSPILTESESDDDHKQKAEASEKRKQRRSKREDAESEEDGSDDSELDDRKESKRRKKEEKKLRKEERRRRREERHRRREERRAHKRKHRSKDSDSASDSEENEDCRAASRAKKEYHSSDDERTESEKKRLEDELREKALQSFRAKRGINP